MKAVATRSYKDAEAGEPVDCDFCGATRPKGMPCALCGGPRVYIDPNRYDPRKKNLSKENRSKYEAEVTVRPKDACVYGRVLRSVGQNEPEAYDDDPSGGELDG